MKKQALCIALVLCLLTALLPGLRVSAAEEFTGPIKQVSLGKNHSAAIKTDGTLWIWGSNGSGRLGDGTTGRRSTPVKVLDNVAAVSLGGNHSAAIKTDGSLWTWGRNYSGQLGDSTTADHSTPVKVLDNVAAVSLGDSHSAAIKTDGSLWTWGWNRYGQLGDGTTTDRSAPVKVLDNVAAVSLGDGHSAAIKTDGSLWTWGFNGHGQLGDGTKTSRSTPVKVLDNVAAVSLGYEHSAAIKTNGSLWTWGYNFEGKLGDGKTTDRSTPVQIAAGGALPATSVTLPDATQYAPYRYAFSGGSGYSLTGGKLPAGLSLGSDGALAGSPTELGVFSFTVTSYGMSYACRLSVLWAGGVDVEKDNESGYGFVETATDDGRVHDQFVTSVEELKPQTMHCEGAFSEFYALYLDARKLTRDVDYTAGEGSTRLTLTDKTLANAGSGTHVLTAEFHTKNSSGALAIKYTTQKYTITGIPGKNVNVVVKGVPVIWTDAEPYVNKDSRTMVPFRAIADALGLTVEWDGTTREAIFSNGSKTIYFPLDSKTARTSTGATVAMDTAAISVNGRSYAPVRYLAEFFGYTVTWDGKTRTVGIS